MLNLNMDDVGEAAIVECEGTLIGGDEALPATRCGHGAGSPRPLKKEGNPMRGSLLHLSSILWVSLLVLSTDVLWAQRTSTLEESAVQLPDAPSRVATVSEAQTSFHLTSNDLEYYGHYMPWAGSVILRIGQQARAHPHIASVLKTVHPQF
jgi:hypothetical protein